MKAFIVVSCLVLVATAQPQGYVYNPPGTGISLTLVPPGPAPQNLAPPSHGPSFSQGLAPVSSHGSLGLGSHSSGGSLAVGSSYSIGGSGGGGGSFGGPASFGGASSFGSGNSFSSSGSFGSGNSFAPAGPAPSFSAPVTPFIPSTNFAPQSAPQTLIQKHIYVHVPPPSEEDEFNAALSPEAAGISKQKHYKIIFIKAPSSPSVSQQIAQAQAIQQQQNEEKTLVYVLVKKPESLEEIQQSLARQPSLSQPSKPEVYFIKYKAQQAGGFSQPIPLSAPIAAPAPQFAPSVSDGSSASSLSSQSTILSPAPELGPIQSSASSAESSASSSSSSSFSSSSGGDIPNLQDLVSEVIQPRTPAAEYGPPKH